MSHLAVKIFHNALSGWFRIMLQIVVFAGLTPFIIATIGKEQFGVWAFALSVVSFCELFDFGLSTTSIKYVAHTQTEGNCLKQNRMLSTVFFCSLGMALLGALTLTVYKILFSHMVDTAFLLVIILGCRLFLINLPFSLYRGVLIGDQKIVTANIIALLGILSYAFLVFFSLKQGYGVVALGVCNLIGAAVEYGLYTFFAYRSLPSLSITFAKADFGITLEEIFSFSSSQFFANIGTLVLNNSDLIIAKFYFPFSFVAVYAIALRLTTYGYVVVKQFTNVLTPVIVSLDAGNKHDQLAKLFVEGSRVALFFSTPILVFSLMMGKTFLFLWLGHDFVAAEPILVLLVIALWLRTCYLITGDMLQMTGYHVTFVWFFSATIIVHLVSASVFPLFFSLPGVALGSLFSAIAGFGLFFPRACREFSIDWRSYGISLARTFLPATCVMVVFLYLFQMYAPPQSFLTFFLACALAALLYLLVLWKTGLSQEEKKKLLYITMRLGDGKL